MDAAKTDSAVVSHPVVRYVGDDAGRRMAWAAAGTGTPAVIALAGLASHVVLDWTDGVNGAFFRSLADRHRLIRFDRPGTGMSDRDFARYDVDHEVDAVRRVLDAAGEEQVAVFARNLSGPVGVAFAARHPDRVSHLVLFGSACPVVAGADRPHGIDPALAEALACLAEAEWGVASSALAEYLLPGASGAERTAQAEYQRLAVGATAAAAIIRDHCAMDVAHEMARVEAPTLVLQRRDDRAYTLGAARAMADAIPGARLQVLDGSASLPFYGDQRSVLDAILAFLQPSGGQLTAREREILHLVTEGLSNREIAAALYVSPHTVARHLANVFLKLDVSTRNAAVAAARRGGLIAF